MLEDLLGLYEPHTTTITYSKEYNDEDNEVFDVTIKDIEGGGTTLRYSSMPDTGPVKLAGYVVNDLT